LERQNRSSVMTMKTFYLKMNLSTK
jgi:hypothetical protein